MKEEEYYIFYFFPIFMKEEIQLLKEKLSARIEQISGEIKESIVDAKFKADKAELFENLRQQMNEKIQSLQKIFEEIGDATEEKAQKLKKDAEDLVDSIEKDWKDFVNNQK